MLICYIWTIVLRGCVYDTLFQVVCSSEMWFLGRM